MLGGSSVGTGFVPIKPDTTGFGTDLEKGLAKEGGPAAKKSGAKMSRVFKAAFASGVALIGKSVMDFSGFERGMNEVFTLLPGISGDAMGKMTEQVKNFSTEFGILPTKVVPALYQSLSAGVPQDNVFAFLKTATKLAKGGAVDLETAVDGLTSVVNAYGPGVLSAQQASDYMFTTVKLGKTTMDELSASMFNVTPTAAALGVKFGDVSAALAAMTLQGVPTSVATTQLRQMLIELSKAGGKTADLFTKLSGKTFKEFIAGGGNVNDALKLVADEAAKSGKSVSDMFGSVEAGAAANVLMSSSTFADDIKAMGDSAGATDAAFATMNKGIGATMDKLHAKFAVVLLNIGAAIAPTVGIVGGFLGDMLDLFSKLPGPMQAVAVILGTVTAGLFAFAKPILAGIQLFGKLNGVFSLLAANPWILVLAGLVVITVLIIKNWGLVKEFLSFVWGYMKKAGTAVADAIAAAWSALADAAKAVWGAIADIFSMSLGLIRAEFDFFISGITAAWDGITYAASATWSAITSTASAAWSAITGIVSGAISGIVSFVTAIPETIAGAFGTLADIIAAPFRAAFGGIQTAWNATVGGFGFTTPDWIPVLGGKNFRIPTMAAGGVLTGPQMLIGGEYPGASTNPEIITPQNIMRETMVDAIRSAPTGPSAGVTITGNSFYIRQESDIENLARQLDRRKERELRAQGRPKLEGAAA